MLSNEVCLIIRWCLIAREYASNCHRDAVVCSF